mmetsp:Transcript_38803/g.76931  ORF Transcript_38803/g.76931 Transcript_38803/m.76931 type:complete len:345 (+) Transcript_38803:106-1140(+)
MCWALLPLLAGTVAGKQVSLEVYYGAECENCLAFVEQGLMPVLHAGLPGTSVRLTLLPWMAGRLDADGLYTPTRHDETVFPHICTLRSFLRGGPIDALGLVHGAEFVACDLQSIALPGAYRDEATLRRCANRSGLSWDGPDGIKDCAEGGRRARAFGLMRSVSYAAKLAATSSYFGPLSVVTPFIYVNGGWLECSGPNVCSAIWAADGRRPLAKPGSLLEAVCSQLNPLPAACQAAKSQHGLAVEAQSHFNRHCENCVEVGTVRWDQDSTATQGGGAVGRLRASRLFLLLSATALIIASAVTAWRRQLVSRQQLDSEKQEPCGVLAHGPGQASATVSTRDSLLE